MHSELVIIDLNSFTKLLETVHICHQDSKSKLSKMCMINDAPSLTFNCCDLHLPVDNLQVVSSENRSQLLNLPDRTYQSCIKGLQYEEVIFISENDGYTDSKSSMNNFDSVFVNIEEEQNSSDSQNVFTKFGKGLSETDPLLLEETLSSGESLSVLEKALTSNLFKVSAKNFLPKVVDWSSGSFENISSNDLRAKRTKYPPVIVCEFCGLQFTNKDRVYKYFQHRNQFHTQEIKYKCPICPKLYWGERELTAHVATHVGKEHTCEYCGITFQRKHDLTRHLLIHEDKKFNCKFCCKLFRRRDHLKIHERIHTHQTPYICPTCSSGFPQKHQLNLHAKKCKSSSLAKNSNICKVKFIACNDLMKGENYL